MIIKPMNQMVQNVPKLLNSISMLPRSKLIAQHMMASTVAAQEPVVLQESNLATRRFILNRPLKLNALSTPMINALRPLIEEWNKSNTCQVVVGSGVGRAFCAGGDVRTVAEDAATEERRPEAVDFFRNEFELDYLLASLKKPYVAILDGITMGGGFGLVSHAPFRVATEKTAFAMPETKIGYCPDVGASHFLSRLDGQLGRYLSLTGNTLNGRSVFQHGLATHYIPSSRIPQLLSHLASLESASFDVLNATLEEYYQEPDASEPNLSITGNIRVALDKAFSGDSVEEIFKNLESLTQDQSVAKWAHETLSTLHQRSPTSLKVALEANKRGHSMTLSEALQMEMNIATALCYGASPDFITGVASVIVNKDKERPNWSPDTVQALADEQVVRDFFDPTSPFLQHSPQLQFGANRANEDYNRYALPSEEEIKTIIRGGHKTSNSFGLSLDELLEKYDDHGRGKHAVQEKILEIVARCCDLAEDPDNHHHLRWRS